MDLFIVFKKLFWDLLHYEIESYSLENKVTYVLKFGKCGKRQFLTRFVFGIFIKQYFILYHFNNYNGVCLTAFFPPLP